ncbi:MAG: hypothetical protein ABR968_01895 [Bacteroidales bacterium]
MSIIICGDSHTQSGINDSILKGAINISQSSEHYLYTYNVLKLFIQNNPQIKTIILGCSFHSFAKSNDKNIFENNRTKNIYQCYFPIFDYKSISELISGNISGIINSAVKILGNMMLSLIYNYKSYRDYSFCGNYYNSNKSNLNDSILISTIKKHYYIDNKTLQNFSIFQKYYLKKIVELCYKNNIKLILINTPLHESYFNKIPAKFISDYYATLSDFKGQIKFWDFHSLHLGNECFGDEHHLNYYGAKKLTLKIDSLLCEKK